RRPAQRQAGGFRNVTEMQIPPRRAHTKAPLQVAEVGAPAQRERWCASPFSLWLPCSCLSSQRNDALLRLGGCQCSNRAWSVATGTGAVLTDAQQAKRV